MEKRKVAYYFGFLGEIISIFIYLLRFYSLIKWRHKTYFGEIDLIFKRGNYLVFVEVKTRKYGDTEIITSYQKERIKRAAQYFIATNPKYAYCDVRFDVVIWPWARPIPIIIKDAW